MEELPRAGKGTAGTSAPIRHDKVRLLVFLYRKPGTSTEEFSTYWRETHSHVFSGLPIVKKNILKYEQIHAHEGAADTIKAAGFGGADFDGVAVFDAYSLEKILEVFEDKEFKDTVIPDEEQFLDRKRSIALPADIVSVFSDPS